MARLRVVLHFRVEKLWVHGELLGTSHEVERNDRIVRLVFPVDRRDFDAERFRASDQSPITGWTGDPPNLSAAGVSIVRVLVDWASDLGADDFKVQEKDDPNTMAALNEWLPQAAETGRQVLHSYLEKVRTLHGQHWLGSSVDRPVMARSAEFIDVNADERIPLGHSDPLDPVILLASRDVLGRKDHEEIIEALRSANDQSPLPEVLLADAKFLGWMRTPTRDREALLLAAIACELKVKSILRSRTRPESAALLDLLIRRTRPTISLFSEVPEALMSRSLKNEEAALFARLQKAVRGSQCTGAQRSARVGKRARSRQDG